MKNPIKPWYYTASVLILIIALVLPILAACDDDDDDETTQPATTQPGTTEPATTTPADTSPIKIGVISDWSGPGAVAGALTNQTLKAMDLYIEEEFGDGPLGGRSVEWVKYDMQYNVAKTVAGVNKLAQENVALILLQGSDTFASAAEDECEKLKIPFLNGTQVPRDMTPFKYAVRTTISNEVNPGVTDFIINVLKPEKVALFGNKTAENIETLERRRDTLETAGIEVVYEDYIELDVRDMSPYLTRIKSENPDLLDIYFGSGEQYVAVMDQITGLGGWGDIQVTCSSGGGVADAVANSEGGDGSYHWTTWAAGLDFPGAKQFDRIWNETFGKAPNPYNFWAWACVTAALHIIDQAGTTDHDEIAQFMHSGELSFEGLNGPYTISKDGVTNMDGVVVQVQNKQFVPVYDLGTDQPM